MLPAARPRILLVLAVVALLTLPAGSVSASTTDTDGDGLTNTFETSLSLTDPNLVDTNGNGISDANEDPDADGLSNIWEQRLGLQPRNADSNANGTPDGSEDKDADGLRNAWEISPAGTDPRTNDTNKNGLRDSAEDPDGDKLSNRGEQRWGTNPKKADTDGDSIKDNAEDANGNGILNGPEQDNRAVPTKLTPTVNKAAADKPVSYADGCHPSSTAPVSPLMTCVYGDPAGTFTVALFGDSHAANWLPALSVVALARHWKIVSVTRSACPSVNVATYSEAFAREDTECEQYRQNAIAWLNANVPNLIMITNLSAYKVMSGGVVVPTSQREALWQTGLASTLDSLPAAARKFVLADTPQFSINVPTCLKVHLDNIAACVTAKSTAVKTTHINAEKTTSTAHGGTFGDLTSRVCSYDPCPIIIDELMMYRDGSHITATYSKSLAPALGPLLDAVVAAP